MKDHFQVTWHGDNLVTLRFARDSVARFIRKRRITVATCEEKKSPGCLEAIIEHAPECGCFDCTGIHPQPLPEPEYDPLEYFQIIIDQGGGIITLGDFLGVVVGDNIEATPAGWLFLPLESRDGKLTAEKLRDFVNAVRPGRAAWPEKETIR